MNVSDLPAASLPSSTPRHIAVIMDGNGRWAKRQGMPRIAGHRKGVEAVRKILPLCGKRGIPYLTLFAFSSENWARPSTEVQLLMDLLASTLENEILGLHENGVRLRAIGDLTRFSVRLQKAIGEAETLTRNNRTLNLTIAINYGGRWDMLQACRSIAELVEQGSISAAALTPAVLESRLSTHELPEPDLFIRTGGEKRISNFLLWQLAYTELYFSDTYWPDFNESCFDAVLEEFARRQRRFGKTSAQLKSIA